MSAQQSEMKTVVSENRGDAVTSADSDKGSGEGQPRVMYSSASPMRHPWGLVCEIATDFWRFRELIWILFSRDLKAMYRQSLLGYVWIFLPPLATTAVWMFLNSQGIVSTNYEGLIPYPVFLLIGTMLWATFSTAVTQPLASFQAGRPVFMKLKVPAEAFIAAGLARVVFDFLVRLVLLLPVFVMWHVGLPLTVLLVPLAICSLLVLGTALGVCLIPLGALYGDVARGITMVLQFLMYLTPVVYLPPPSGWAAAVIGWNPVTPVLMTARDWLAIGPSEYVVPMLLVTGISIVALLMATIATRIAMPHLVQRMGM